MILIPNALTLLRFIAGPVSLWFLWHDDFERGLFVVYAASLTDFFDGFLARQLKCTSAFGEIFDPLADKIFVLCLLTYFASHGFLSTSVILLLREAMILSGGVFLKIKNPDLALPPLWIGKIHTFLVLICFMALIHGCLQGLALHETGTFPMMFELTNLGQPGGYLNARLLGYGTVLLLYSIFITTGLSALGYIRVFFKIYRAS